MEEKKQNKFIKAEPRCKLSMLTGLNKVKYFTNIHGQQDQKQDKQIKEDLFHLFQNLNLTVCWI